jgi:predicted transcriptional regulator
MSDEPAIKERDLRTLAGIVKGTGFYATPSADRIKRLIEKGLIKQQSGALRPTLKGRIIAFLRK